MTEQNQDFEMYTGETKAITFTITGIGSIVGLTACWVMWAGDDFTAEKTTTDGIVLADLGATITAVVSLVPADTEDLDGGTEDEPKTYNHQLRLVDASSNEAIVSEGAVSVIKSRASCS